MQANDHIYERIRELRGPTKHCGSCGVNHPIELFALKSTEKLTLQSRCRAAQRQASNAWYAANAEKHRAAAATRRKTVAEDVADLVDRWLAGQSCSQCGSAHRLVAVGPTGTSLKRLVKDGWSRPSIEALLPQAVVACRRCRQAPTRLS